MQVATSIVEAIKPVKTTTAIEHKDFFWDQFVSIISGAILALTLVNVTAEIFKNEDVVCYTSALALLGPTSFASSEALFINTYCANSLPYTELFPVFILIHGVLLIAPHFIWNAIHKGDFNSFFAVAGEIDRLRTGETGEYNKNNFDIVKKLAEEYAGRSQILLSYVAKLFVQLVVCAVSIGVSAGCLKDFSFSFDCPQPLAEYGIVPREWPLNATIPCVYNSLRILRLVRIADFFLTACAAVLILYGLLWCLVKHTQLGYQEAAEFAFQSCLSPEMYVFPPIIQFRDCRGVCSLNLRSCFSPRLKNDLDFFLLSLFRADGSHGKVFKDILFHEKLVELVGRDHQILNLYNNIEVLKSDKSLWLKIDNSTVKSIEPASGRIHSLTLSEGKDRKIGCLSNGLANCCSSFCCCCFRGEGKEKGDEYILEDPELKYESFRDIFTRKDFNGNPEKEAFAFFKPFIGDLEVKEGDFSGMRETIYQFIREHGRSKDGKLCNTIAVDISFGTIGYSLVLSRPFLEVVSVIFHPHFHGIGEDVFREDKFLTNYHTFTYPEDTYSLTRKVRQPDEKVIHCVQEVRRRKTEAACVEVLMVGPVNNERQIVSIHLFLNGLTTFKCIGDGALLLAIRPLRICDKEIRTYKYVPPERLFMRRTPQECDEAKAYNIRCGRVFCKFEFEAYTFRGYTQLGPRTNIPQTNFDGEGGGKVEGEGQGKPSESTPLLNTQTTKQ